MKKFTITDLENTHATSDEHFYHTRVIEYCNRPFATVEEMNEIMILKWNQVVKPTDTVFCFGDFSMAFRSVELFTKRLNGYKILIAGNHDFVHPAHKKSRNPENQQKWIESYLANGWNEVHITAEIEIPGVATVNANHLPYIEPGDSGQDIRHAKHRLVNDGRWLICGHVHQHWTQRYKMINVGVDVRDFRPITFKEIADIINASPEGYPELKWEEIPKEDL